MHVSLFYANFIKKAVDVVYASDLIQGQLSCRTINMADSSVKVAKLARILAIAHIIVGFLPICFGIADRVVEYLWAWTSLDRCLGKFHLQPVKYFDIKV